MDRIRFIPNNNQSVIRMLSKKYEGYNKGRNRILMGAVCLCIVTLTMVFGITTGKVRAEYLKAARAAGTTASATISGAGDFHYQKVRSLGYVKQAGRRVSVGWASVREPAAKDEDFNGTLAGKENGRESQAEKTVCRLQLLDRPAWEQIVSPAYTDIHGHYPVKEQEIMLPVRAMKVLGIDDPKEGMKVGLTAGIGLFREEQEEFILSGWYTDYVDSASDPGTGYISEAKCKDWGYDIGNEADILICQSDSMEWREAEARLYQDVVGKGSDLRVTAGNTFAGDALNRMMGSYEMAIFGALIILGGMFFLVHNVMQISMAGDVRQMGLLNTIGTTKKQLRRIYLGQIRGALVPGVLMGMILSAFVLLLLVPGMLGKQYLSGYGGAEGLKIFRPGILAAAVGFAVLLTLLAAAGVIWRVVSVSCVDSMNYVQSMNHVQSMVYIPIKKNDRSQRAKTMADTAYLLISKESRFRKPNCRKRSAGRELWYMAWQNLIRNKGRFLLTVFSLFLGLEAFLGTIVITEGSDYSHVIEKRPDFLIAGEFSSWGQEEGYGREYLTRDAGEDPMETEGDNFALLYGNLYDEFSPISPDVRADILSLEGVDIKSSYVMEGAYMTSAISQKGIKPLCTPGIMGIAETQKACESEDSMFEGFTEDVIQILSDEELLELRQYVEEQGIPVDIDSLTGGTGVMILHDHMLSPKQEGQARESVGEPVYFITMRSKEDSIRWDLASDEERETMEDTRKRSETFTLSGYLDNRVEGFPHIRQTWHGAEGSIYYLISEKGFEKLPTKKKTLYMELNVDKEKEAQVKAGIHDIIARENQRRKMDKVITETDTDQEEGEAGIFCISKSDLRRDAANEIRGNRRILGSISIILLFAGLTNYFNVTVTGILARRKEFEVMESIGMTRKQKRNLLIAEGMYYCVTVGLLILTVGSGILWLICRYMESRLSYFVCGYPLGWILKLIVGLTVVCVGTAAGYITLMKH